MSQTTARAVRPTTAADLWRLADQGRRNGVRILTECVSGERFATSASEPGTLYRLTAYSCTCPGYTHAGRCQHHSLLLADLGWLPDTDTDPEPPTPAAPALAPAAAPEVECPECDGVGCAGFDEDDEGRYWPVGRCGRCEGEGIIPSPPVVMEQGCGWCDGRGYHTKESAIFVTTYCVNCLPCRGIGVEPAWRAA